MFYVWQPCKFDYFPEYTICSDLPFDCSTNTNYNGLEIFKQSDQKTVNKKRLQQLFLMNTAPKMGQVKVPKAIFLLKSTH